MPKTQNASPLFQQSLLRSQLDLRRHKLDVRDLLQLCLEEIDQQEEKVQAWELLEREQALKEAEKCEQEARKNLFRGPLHGVPLGIKDTIDVRGMATKRGTLGFEPEFPLQDAWVVEKLRLAGCIPLGKTTSTEFAYMEPSKTRNPWNLTHTPGGSSSGSAAALASRMCLLSLGTQTAASITRPAAYNGVVGFKASLGALPMGGVFPLSWMLDHLGWFTTSVSDSYLVWQTLNPTQSWQHLPSKMPPLLVAKKPVRVAVLEEYIRDANLEVKDSLDKFLHFLKAKGVEVEKISLPRDFSATESSHKSIMACEAACLHQEGFQKSRHKYSFFLRSLIATGNEVSGVEYIEATHTRELLRRDLNNLMQPFDFLLTPAAPEVAPKGLESTGDPSFSRLFSLCGLPTLALPVEVNVENLPMGVQLVGHESQEENLFAHAAFCESLLGFSYLP